MGCRTVLRCGVSMVTLPDGGVNVIEEMKK
jgi:hypothetical protein